MGIPATGRARALALIAEHTGGYPSDQHPNIIVELFPDWFDFSAERFGVLGTSHQLRLIFCNPDEYRSPDHALISTSDSRLISCSVSRHLRVEHGEMNLGRPPSLDQRENARLVIALALRALHPYRDDVFPAEVLARIPEGRVFPREEWE